MNACTMYLTAALAAPLCIAQSPTTTSLRVNPAVPALGQPATLTATIMPPPSSGKVTFYDGASILGTSSVVRGVASFTTIQLAPGKRSLRAFFGGTGNSAPSSSGSVAVTVSDVPGFGFIQNGPHTLNFFPWSAAVADFDGDGKLDIAVANEGSAFVSVLLGDGTGNVSRSAPGTPFSTDFGPISVATADFDGNGTPDIVVANFIAGTVQVFLCNPVPPDGSVPDPLFKPGEDIKVGENPISVVVADFNLDGIPDFAVANSNDATISVLIGNGDGTFRSAGGPFPVGALPYSIAVGDFNGDGKPDIAAASQGQSSITVLLGDGNGAFTNSSTSPIALDYPPRWIAAGDFNNDGISDLAVAYNVDAKLTTVLLGKGDGSFAALPPFSSQFSFALTVGDFNGDGNQDIAAVDYLGSFLTVYYGDGAGNFSAGKSIALPGTGPVGVTTADFNGDGRLDVVVVDQISNDVTVMLATPAVTASFGQPVPSSVCSISPGGSQNCAEVFEYPLTVVNEASQQVTGGVMVTATFPLALPVRAASGPDWSCALAPGSVTCTRTDPLVSSYPAITVVVGFTPAACPNDMLTVTVTAANSSFTNTYTSFIQGCVDVTQTPAVGFGAGLTVGVANQVLTLNLAPVNPPNGAMALTVVDVLPIGLGLTGQTIAAGTNWNCEAQGQTVTCTYPATPGATSFPPITIPVNVQATGCPSTTNTVEVMLDRAAPFTISMLVPLSGCLSLSAPANFGSTVLGSGVTRTLIITSNDSSPVTVDVLLSNTSSVGSAIPSAFNSDTNCRILNSGQSCSVVLYYIPPCLGTQIATLRIEASVSGVALPAVYGPFTITGTGAATQASFSVGGGAVSSSATVAPNNSEPVAFNFSPAQQPGCTQPLLVVSNFTPSTNFMNLVPGGVDFDVKITPGDHQSASSTSGSLQTGTVAGSFALGAYVGAELISISQNSSFVPASVTLMVPPQVGVVEKVGVGGKTSSSFDVSITGYSTPREVGSGATTQVCFTFSAASGSSLGGTTEFCPAGVQQDIEIWYERTESFPTGSQFAVTVSVAFSGDSSAIGRVQAVIKNSQGTSAPYCVDFASGQKLNCGQ